MIAQPVLSTHSTHPQANAQAQPPANGNGFLSLLAPDNASLLTSPSANTPPAATANSDKPGNSNDGNANTTGTPYLNAPTQSTIVPTGASQAASTAAANGDASTALSATADQLSLNGNAIPSNAVLPGTDAQTASATDASGGNNTGFGADVNARIAAGAPIYASQPTAAMASVPPHLLNAASQDQPGAAPKSGDADTQKSSADSADEPLPGSSAAAPAAATLHPGPVTPAPSQTDAANDQNNNAPTQPTSANGATAAGNGGDASAASASLAAQPNAPVTTPAQMDAAVHTPAPYVPVGEQVALNLKQALAADNNQIRIQLKPASLGTIDVKLNLTQDGRVSAVISADRSDTLNMLKQDSATLQQSLRDAGLNADGNSLSFNLRGDAQSFAQNSSQGSFGRSGGNGGNSYGTAGGDSLSITGSRIASQSYHDGSLDIEV